MGIEEQSEQKSTIKIYLVGDSGCGKSDFLKRYLRQEVDFDETIPTVIDSFDSKTSIENKEIDVTFWDTPGLDDYTDFRTMCYPKKSSRDCYAILCYSSVSDSYFDNIVEKWIPELIQNNFNTSQILLLGMKTDMRGYFHSDRVPIKKALDVKNMFQLLGHKKCTATNEKSVDAAINAIYQHWRRNQVQLSKPTKSLFKAPPKLQGRSKSLTAHNKSRRSLKDIDRKLRERRGKSARDARDFKGALNFDFKLPETGSF